MSVKSDERGVETVSSLCYSALNLNNWIGITPLPNKLQGRCKKVSVYDSCLLIKSHLDYEFSRTYSVNFFQELNFIPMFQLKLCCLSDDWPRSLHSSAEAIRETSFSFISFISFSILISVSLTESLNLPIFQYDLGKILQVMQMPSFDSWGQTKTAHQIQIFQGIYGWNFEGKYWCNVLRTTVRWFLVGRYSMHSGFHSPLQILQYRQF